MRPNQLWKQLFHSFIDTVKIRKIMLLKLCYYLPCKRLIGVYMVNIPQIDIFDFCVKNASLLV